MVAPGAVARAKPKAVRLWWLVHQWAGLKFSILVSFILFTGTLAVFGHELDWLMRPAMRVDVASVQGPVAWPEIAANVAAAYPGAKIEAIDAPIDPWFAAIVTVATPEGGAMFVYAHPTTGAIQGDGDWIGAQRILRNMHRHLNMPVAIGVPIVSSLSFLLLISLVTSFVVYKKWWAGFFKPIRLRDPRVAWGDAHRLAGLWSLWFVALMIVTGLWYLAEELGARAPNLPSAQSPAIELTGGDLAQALAASLAAAQAASPGLRIKAVRFPDDANGAFLFQGQDRAMLVRPRANAVWVDAAGASVLAVTDGRELTAHQRISEAADPLHFGTFGGFGTKLIWFVFGMALTVLSVSGVVIYALRLTKADRTAPGAPRGEVATAWRGMGPWRWPALGLVLLGLILIAPLFAAA